MPASRLPQLVAVEEASQTLGVSRQQVTSLLRQGKIPGAWHIGRTWVIDRDSFQQYARSRNRGTADAAPAAMSSATVVSPLLPVEDAYRLIADSTYDWESWRGPDGRFLYCSPSCERITGYAAEEFLANPALLSEIVHAEDRPAFAAHEAGDDRAAGHLELRLTRRDGSECWIEHVCQPLFAADGSRLGSRSSNRDITVRKGIEREREGLLRQVARLAADLQEERDVLHSTMDNTRAHLAYLDRDLNFVRVNPAYAESCGYTPEEMIGLNHFALYPHAENEAIFRRVRDSGEPARYTAKPFGYPDQPERGTTYWDWTLMPVKDEAGATQGLVLSLVDVTEVTRARKRTTELANEAARRAAELDAIITSIADGVLIYSPAGEVVSANPAAHRLGVANGTAGGGSVPAVLLDGNGQPLPGEWLPSARALRGQTVAAERVMLRRGNDAEPIWALVSAAPLRGLGCGQHGAVVAYTDVTELSRAEEALRQSERRYRLLFEEMISGFALHEIICDEEGRPVDYRFLEINPVFERLTGLRAADIVGKTVLEVLPETEPFWIERYGSVALTGRPAEFDGHSAAIGLDYEVRAFCPEPGKFAVVFQDVSDRRRAERERERLLTEVSRARARAEASAADSQARAAELEQQRSLLDAVLAQMPAGVMVADAATRRLTLINDRIDDILQSSLNRDAIIGEDRLYVAFDAEGRPYDPEEFLLVRALMYGELPSDREVTVRRGDGAIRTLNVNAAPVRDAAAKITAGVNVLVDVTEQREAERALAEERQRLAITLRSIGDGVIATDAEARVTIMSRAAEAMTGWSEQEAMGKPLDEVFTIFSEITGDRAQDPVRRVLETGQVQGLANHTVLVSRDGIRHVLADSAAPIVADGSRPVGVVLVFQDVTEKHYLEEERAKVNKLESLGVLAGGIAHDFNNLLTGIMGNIILARMDVPDRPEVDDTLEEAEKAATRAKGLTQQLLTFAKGGMPLRKTTPLAGLLSDAASFALRGRNSQLSMVAADDLWLADIDPGQIGQVIQNLVINADDAMPGGGLITIRATNVVVTEVDMLPLPPGPYVSFTVEDGGMGIPKDIQSRVFDPYFTTKAHGSGIGLAVVYSVVVKHDGYVTLESELDKGSTFRVYLPAATYDGTARAAAAAGDSPCQAKVLVMDDEEIVRSVAERMFRRLGCEVQTAADGADAVRLYHQALADGARFDVVVLDVYVPGGMGGPEALARLKEMDPGVCAIVSSGYSTDPIMGDHAEYGFAAAVDKPYRMEDLSAVLVRVLA
ncbi:MAG: PAS domain S-box protein [Anaerolineae bacterium]